MNKKQLTYIIAGPGPDREKLVAEIYFGKEMVGEISNEGGPAVLALWGPRGSDEPWEFDLHEFQQILETAKRDLLQEVKQ